MRTTILYEDKDIIVAHKPSGMATETARVGQVDMVSELKNYINTSNPYLGVVHRLDQPVEGLLVFGRTKAATAALSRQLADKSLNKRYYAIIDGQPVLTEGELVDYLYKNKENRAQIVPEDLAIETGAKRALLRYRILESRDVADGLGDRDKISLAEIVIETGRFHQIRAQMAHAGMPLLGDIKYGTEASKGCSAGLYVQNAALCAYEIEFGHPTRRERMHFQIDPQEKIFSLFGKFAKNNRG